jgi:MoaA/NifB/PqqE/SkfB family radical SAM enzyme
LELKTAQIYDYEKGSDLIPDEGQFSRYRHNGHDMYSIKNEHQNKCWKMWHSCVMTWDGDIVPCCFDKDAKYTMGNIHQQSFKDIWNGDKYQEFRAGYLMIASNRYL